MNGTHLKRSIEVTVQPSGEIAIDAVGFRGADCEQATRYLEEALGALGSRQKKPEYHQRQHSAAAARLMNTPVSAVLTFTPDGTGHGLYTEAIELSAIGPLSIRRATTIEFNNPMQQWEVRSVSGDLLYCDPSRESCLAWEQQHFNQ